jgi:hypothetical protein
MACVVEQVSWESAQSGEERGPGLWAENVQMEEADRDNVFEVCLRRIAGGLGGEDGE